MKSSSPPQMPDDVEGFQKSRDRFRKRVFRLVHEGYSRLRNQGKNYTNSVEEEISHDLTEEIEKFLGADDSPRWVEKFSVYREHPISPHGEVGIQRPRLDILIRSGEKQHCPMFVFEAKRLRYSSTKPSDYFGKKGIQCFWNEKGYPINVFREAGMLGYIQNKDVNYWVDWLKIHFEKRRENLHVSNQSGWDHSVQSEELQNIFCTRHQPNVQDDIIVMFHLLLVFF